MVCTNRCVFFTGVLSNIPGNKIMGSKLLLLFVVICCAALPASGASLEDVVGRETAARLRSAASPAGAMPSITDVQLRSPSPRLLPSQGDLRRLVLTSADQLNPNLFIENLSLYHKPAPHDSAAAWSETERAALFNQALALSSLAGIEYFSERRGVMRVFYEISHVIDSPANRNRLPDPVYAHPPPDLRLYARQKDQSFGDNVYLFDYYTSTDALFFVQENVTAMSYGIIPAVSRGRYRSVIAVIDLGDSLLLYAATMARTASLPGLGDRIGSSISHRVDAVLKWFAARASMVYR